VDPTRLTRAGWILAAILFVHSAATTPFWANAARAFDPRVPARAEPVPASAMAAALDAALGPEAPVALSERVRASRESAQYIAAVLAPRRIDRSAAHVLDVLPPSAVGPDVQEIARDAQGGVWVLRGPSVAAPSPPRSSFSWLGVLASALAALGWGLAIALAALRGRPDPLDLPGLAVLGGALAAGVLSTVATVLQVSVPWTALRFTGLALLVAGVAWLGSRRDLRRGAWIAWKAAVRRPESLLLGALAVATFARVAIEPTIDGDGRTIWMLHARQVHAGGALRMADLTHPETAWSHPEYPLLLPAWLSTFASFGGAFDERAARLGLPVLLAGLLSLVYRLARARLGRFPGAALTFAAFFSFEELAAAGYADPPLALLLFLQFFGLTRAKHRSLGWLAAFAASLLKVEGLVLSAALAMVVLFGPRALRPEGGPKRLLPLAGFALGLVHLAWTRSLGLGDYREIPWERVAGDLAERIGTILGAAPAATARYPIVAQGWGAFAVAVALGLWLRRTGRARAGPWLAVCLGASLTLFAVAVLALTPHDVGWHAETALDRLLLHPAIFLVAAPFWFLSDADVERPEAERRVPGE
jgi:hypothetical protein